MKVEKLEGRFLLPKQLNIFISQNDSGLKKNAKFLAEKLRTAYGLNSEISINPITSDKSIILSLDSAFNYAEGYMLKIDTRTIRISGPTAAGIFYGIQSLLQLMPAKIKDTINRNANMGINCIEVTDYPRFQWRGMHLDVCRHFFQVSFIKKYIDYLAAYKMNVFHWHLTEDQGWRIEIKKYPRLTEIGGWRTEDDGTKYGGFYTQQQIKEIVKYAADRYITIVPEIEMPGHATALLYAYPELACTDSGPKKIANSWGIFYDVMNPGKEETFKFIDDVLTEIAGLFPGQYIHIGGDECPKEQWKNNKLCQDRIKVEKLKDETELQSYFVKRVEKIVASKGKKLIGWDEILEGGLAPEAIVMSWRGSEGAIAAANLGHDVVMVPSNYVYLNLIQGDIDQEPFGHTPLNTLEHVYNFDPVPGKISVENRKHILGGQGCLWTEYVPDPEMAEYMLFPRFMALSEVYWSQPENKDFESFKPRMIANFSQLAAQQVNFRIPKPTGLKLKNMISKPIDVSLENPLFNSGANIRYTIDGPEPSIISGIYNSPLKIKPGQVLKAKLFLNSELISETVTGRFYKNDTLKSWVKCELYNNQNTTFQLTGKAKPFKTINVPDINPNLAQQGTKADIIKFIGKYKIENAVAGKFYIKADASYRLFFDNNIVAEKSVQPGVRTLTEFNYKPIKQNIEIVLEYAIGQGGEILEAGNVNSKGECIPLSPDNFN